MKLSRVKALAPNATLYVREDGVEFAISYFPESKARPWDVTDFRKQSADPAVFVTEAEAIAHAECCP